MLFWASQVVFSARIGYENNAAQCEELKESTPVILPQGKCEVTHIKKMEELDENKKQRIRKLFRPDSLPDDTVVILGAGSVQLRKGVDLFLACAARVVGLHPQNTFRFVWWVMDLILISIGFILLICKIKLLDPGLKTMFALRVKC